MVVLEWMPDVVVTFLSTIIGIKLIEKPARRLGLVDKPGRRKHHVGVIPITGGLAMCASLLFWVFLSGVPLQHYQGLLAAIAVLVAVGVSDDLHSLTATWRLIAQIAAAVMLTWLGNVELNNLGDLLGFGIIQLQGWSLPFTAICVVGVINALNMIDGLDGLAGGISFIAIFCLTILIVPQAGHYQPDVKLTLLCLGVIAGFLFFNLRHPWRQRASVFMGDAGSMMLGVVLVWLAMDLSQREQPAFAPITAVWILGLPLLDTMSVMIRRIINGKSPFRADRDHVHHILLMYGWSETQTTCILLVFSTALGGVGVSAWYFAIPEYLLFYGFLMLFGLYFFGFFRAVRDLQKIALLREVPETASS